MNVWWRTKYHIKIYPQTSDTRRALVGNKIVDDSDVVWAAPKYIFILDLAHGFNKNAQRQLQDETMTFKFCDSVPLILEAWQ